VMIEEEKTSAIACCRMTTNMYCIKKMRGKMDTEVLAFKTSVARRNGVDHDLRIASLLQYLSGCTVLRP